MASYNKVILMGNLTRDPDLRSTPKGTQVCALSLAVNRTYKDEAGNTKDETTYVDVSAFGKQAEVLAKYMTKGKPLLVEGRLKLDSWEKDGEKRSKLSVILESFQFVGSKDSTSDNTNSQEVAAPAAPAARARSGKANNATDEDVPF